MGRILPTYTGAPLVPPSLEEVNASALKQAIERSHQFGPPLTFEGRPICLAQAAYADGSFDDPHYSAEGVDDAGNTYEVRWELAKSWDAIVAAEDEGDACDWTKYTVRAC